MISTEEIMNPRLRLVIVIAIVIIIIGVVVAVVLPSLNGGGTSGSGGTSSSTGGGNVSTGPTDTPAPTITPMPMVELVIAVQQIPRGFTIPPNAVTTRPWPEVSAPASAIFNLESVIGKKARTDIFREQPILTNMLVDDLANLANVGSDAAAVLPNNRVAVAIPMDRITSVAYAIQPGDRVDVMVTLLFVDVDPVFQTIEPNNITLYDPVTGERSEGIQGYIEDRSFGAGVTQTVIVGPSETQRPRMVTQRTVQDALVVWVGDFPINGRLFFTVPSPTPVPTVDESASASGAKGNATEKPTPIPPRPDIITLAVSPQDAVVLTWMMEARLPITFALRSATSTSQVPTDPVNLQYITETFRIDIPGRLDYSIQPAPDSIRQLFVGSRISLNNAN
jgi:pilus assembly protein CpaB